MAMIIINKYKDMILDNKLVSISKKTHRMLHRVGKKKIVTVNDLSDLQRSYSQDFLRFYKQNHWDDDVKKIKQEMEMKT
jgi:hypothetical protein